MQSRSVFSRKTRTARGTDVEILRAKIDALESALAAGTTTARLEQILLGGLQRIASDNAARDSVVEHLWTKVIDREHDLAAAIEHLLDVSTALADRLDAQDREQRVLVELLRVGLRRLEPGTEKVIGGSVPAGDQNEADVIELDEPRRGDEWHTAS
jgi:hypothetical protein